MFEHLLDFDEDFTDATSVAVDVLLNAQQQTAARVPLVDFDAGTELLTDLQRKTAQAAFVATTNPDMTVEDKRAALLALRTPVAVAHLTTMLDQYDWEFVDHARSIRGYVVAKLLEETRHPDARIRLRALELTGKLTEVASFTERTEIIKRDVSSSELEERIRTRLDKFQKLLQPTPEVETIETAVIVKSRSRAPEIQALTPTKDTP